MAIDNDSGILFGCTYCSLVFPTKSDKNVHILSHFQQKHCDGCNQILICVADVWYQAHVNENCVNIKEEIDHDRPIEFECVNLSEHLVNDLAIDTDEQERDVNYENDTAVKIEAEPISKPEESAVSTVSVPQGAKRIIRVKKTLNRCDICLDTYKLASSLIRHRRNAHRNEIMASSPFTCDACVLPFTNKYFFQRHMSDKHGIKNALENEESNNSTQLAADVGNSANSSLFANNEPKRIKYIDDSSMNLKKTSQIESTAEPTHETNIETVLDKSVHRCVLCSATYTLASSLIRHRRFVHRNEIMVDSPFTCDLCVLPFTNKYFFQRHMSDKHGIDNIPDNHMTDVSDIVQPADSHIPVDAAFLSDCDDSENIPNIDDLFSKQSETNDDSAEDALESSDESAPDKDLDKIANRCEICSATYSSASCLIRHKRHAHRAEFMASSPFACEQCVLPFTSKYFYRRHLLEKHGEMDSPDESQTKETNQNSTIPCDDVLMNDKDDIDDIPAIDDIDIKECRDDSNAESEEDSPSETSAHQSLPETNSETAVLNKLMNRCEICSTTYSSASCLIRHKRYVHRSETMANSPFTCEECVLPFTSKYFYRRHLIEKHGAENMPDELQSKSTDNSEQPTELNIPSDIEDLENAPSMDSFDFETLTKNEQFPNFESDDSSNSNNKPGTSRRKKQIGLNSRQCDLCPATYQNLSSLLKHRRNAHPTQCMEESRFKCDICVLPFKMEYHYTRHMLEKHDIHVVIAKDGAEPSTSDHSENDDTDFQHDTGLLDKKKTLQADPLTEPQKRLKKPKTKCCPLCPAKYSLASSLLRHKRAEHSEQIKADWNLQCDQCSERFKDKRFFMKHMFKKHGVGNLAVLEKMRTIQCPLCDLRCEHPSSLIKHKRSKHGAELIAIGWVQCEICKLPYQSQLKLERHLIDGHGVTETENYRAEEVAAGAEIKSEQPPRAKEKPSVIPTTSITPRKIILRRKRFNCSLCPAVFHNPSAFATHRRTKHRAKILKVHPKAVKPKHPNPPLKYRCTACPLSYTTMNSLCRHRRQHHSSLRKTFGCHVCANQFYTIEKLRQHMFEEHNKTLIPHKPRFICHECQMPYGSPHLLVNHMKTHSDIQFKCCIEPCNECFEMPDELNEHLLKHLRVDRADTRKTCDKCNKTYLLWNFVGHNCTIEVNRPKYMCDHCGRMFRYPDRLRAHINTHTGARPFKCSTCNKSFSHKTVLKQHETIHSNLKPLKCKVEDCGQAFKVHKQLYLHEFNAHGIYRTAHTCPVCNRIFHEKVPLRNHMKSHHGISSEPL